MSHDGGSWPGELRSGAFPTAGTSSSQHPEDLLDGARLRELAPAEWHRLRAHLARCRVCLVQWRLSRTAGRGRSTKDAYLDQVAMQKVLQRVDEAKRFSSRAGARLRVALVMGTVLLSGTATATVMWSVARPPEPPPAAPAPAMSQQQAAPERTSVGAGAARALDPLPAASAELALDVTPNAPDARPPTSISAAELFERARSMRLHGDLAAARATYRVLQREYPRARETVRSFLIVGRMLLDSATPELAVGQFTQYLVARGPASREALVGRATAFGRLHRAAQEAADWRALLSRYPGSSEETQARVRLGEIRAVLSARSSKP